MRGLIGVALQGMSDEFFHLDIGDLARRPWTRLIRQAFQPGLAKSASPLAHSLIRDPQLPRYLTTLPPLGAAQHNTRPQRQPLCSLRPPRPLLKLATLFF